MEPAGTGRREPAGTGRREPAPLRSNGCCVCNGLLRHILHKILSEWVTVPFMVLFTVIHGF
jgi:hypothetical protein